MLKQPLHYILKLVNFTDETYPTLDKKILPLHLYLGSEFVLNFKRVINYDSEISSYANITIDTSI